MKSKNVVFLILGIILVVAVIGIAYIFANRRTYILNLPQVEKLKNISLKQNDEERIISESDEMEELLKVINGVKRVTKEESIQDSPVNIDNLIKIDFYFVENGVSTIFVYKKNNNYYIEQPYNGIYQINSDEYDFIEKAIK